ncbi:MAG TPA: small basic protein [Planctomycetes bacterium]|jgi:small basic protein (TIGR04137 family)|nr:small basic protein [Planctomycetota bacterium]
MEVIRMSLHRSLVIHAKLSRSRSVLTRAERIDILKRDGKFTEGKTSVYGLPKVRMRAGA